MNKGKSRRGRLIVLSGPSGSGKSTIVARLLAEAKNQQAKNSPPLRLAVSATTRKPRPGELDGVHYYFWTEQAFRSAVARGDFLEWAEVHGQLYGTPKSEVGPCLDQGVCVILEIDVQGARQVRELHPDCVMAFLRTSSLEEYGRRLRARSTEDEPAIERRLAAAREELKAAGEYDLEIINDKLDEAVQALRNLWSGQGGSKPCTMS